MKHPALAFVRMLPFALFAASSLTPSAHGQHLWTLTGGTENAALWTPRGETSGGVNASSRVVPQSARVSTEFSGIGDPSSGGTAFVIGTIARALYPTLPEPSVRSSMRALINADFDPSAEGAQCVLLHHNALTGACSIGGVNIQTGLAFVATRSSSGSAFVIHGSQVIPNYVPGQTYELLLTSGDTRMVLHVYSRGAHLVRIPADGLTLAPGLSGVALLASAGQTQQLRGSFRAMQGEKTTNLDYSNDEISDLCWVSTAAQRRLIFYWDLNVAQAGETEIVSMKSGSGSLSNNAWFDSREYRVADVRLFSQPFRLVDLTLSFDANGADFETGLSSTFGGFSAFGSAITWNSVVRDWLRLGKREWSIAAFDDFDRSGVRDQLWHNRFTGEVSIVLQTVASNVESPIRRVELPIVADTNWRILGAGDIDDDGFADILWHNQQTGQLVAWYLDATRLKRWVPINTLPSGWSFVGIGSYDAQPGNDIMWRNDTSGLVGFWSMSGGVVTGWQEIAVLPDSDWVGGG